MVKFFTQKLIDDLQAILLKYPSLNVVYENQKPLHIEGLYQVLDNKKNVQGEYHIKVNIPDKYPYAFPKLTELSNYIERTIDRHINDRGEACVELTHKAILRAKKGISISDFFDEYVHRYFCWQILYEHGYHDELQEWAHGDAAIYDFYKEILGISQIDKIISFIKSAYFSKKLSPNKECPCLSGKKIKYCHHKRYDTVVSLGKDRLNDDYYILSRIKLNKTTH